MICGIPRGTERCAPTSRVARSGGASLASASLSSRASRDQATGARAVPRLSQSIQRAEEAYGTHTRYIGTEP